ncbi:DUF3800 domain-containing protein (plasmid) [Psychrobacillus glaciei]|uniref:DUF3800 domain-containing protein n=1 Tax=Psychrobacillus glaciei TaxID=2283160 RepID=A0A5J6SUV9_9BACI|nr:DUF3800 domain-containing protein [Psychrobacillus glaciei]
MFIDETGSVDDQGTFGMTGVIFEYKYSVSDDERSSELKKRLDLYKLSCFNDKNLTIHLNDISRGKKEFEGFTADERALFIKSMPEVLGSLEFQIISVTIDKGKLNSYFSPSKNPYIIAFTHILEAFYLFIEKVDAESARIVIEARDDKKNLTVQKAFFDVYSNGTIHVDCEKYKDKIAGFIVAEKGTGKYQYGLEIADMVCNPIHRVRQGKIELAPKCFRYPRDNKIFSVIKSKIFSPSSDPTDIRNWGFKMVPVLKKKKVWSDTPS